MYFKLFLLFAVAVSVSHSAAVAGQISHVTGAQLINNAYYKYIKEHQLEDTSDQLITFMINYENSFKKWVEKIHDASSQEYKDLVAQQNGNTVISTDEDQLKRQFYDWQQAAQSSSYKKGLSQLNSQNSQTNVENLEKTVEKTFTKENVNQISSLSNEENHSSVNEFSHNSVLGSNVEVSKKHESKQSVFQGTSQSSSSYQKETSQIKSQQSQGSVYNEQSYLGNSNLQQTQLSNEEQFASNSIASTSVNKHESEYSMSGSNDESYLGNSNVQQSHGIANSIQSSNEKQFASNSVSKHESEYTMSGSNEESYLGNSNVQQTHGIENSIQSSNEKQFASNSVSKHESEYSTSGSSVDKQQVNEYNTGYIQSYGAASTESSSVNYAQNNQNSVYHSSVNNNAVLNNNYHHSIEGVEKQNNVNDFSHHEDNSQIFQDLVSKVARFSKETVNQIATKKLTQQQKQEDLIRSRNAHYSFANTADNNIEGNYLHRLETRKDGKVYGRYSYDDGNFFVTRYYFADENGFRIVKEFNEPSKKKGHQLNGEANVDFVSEGGTRGYHITRQDIHKCHD